MRTVLTVGGVFVLAASLTRQPADALAAYRAAIDAYRSSAPVDDRSLDPRTAADESSLVDRAADPASGWTAVDLEAAAMRETDAGLRLVKADGRADARVYFERA